MFGFTNYSITGMKKAILNWPAQLSKQFSLHTYSVHRFTAGIRDSAFYRQFFFNTLNQQKYLQRHVRDVFLWQLGMVFYSKKPQGCHGREVTEPLMAELTLPDL